MIAVIFKARMQRIQILVTIKLAKVFLLFIVVQVQRTAILAVTASSSKVIKYLHLRIFRDSF